MWVYDNETKNLHYYSNDELYHYGRKGMKWGQHIFGKVKNAAVGAGRFAKNTATDIKNKRAAKEEAERKAQRAKITNPKKLTDDELKERIARLQKEKEYKDLLKNTAASKRGHEFVTDIMESIGKNLFTQVGNHYGAEALNKMIGKEVIFANNKKK